MTRLIRDQIAELIAAGVRAAQVQGALPPFKVGLIPVEHSRQAPRRGDYASPAAMGLAKKIAANPPIAMRYMKEGLRRSRHATMEEMGEFVGNALAYLFTTEDHREGALSFVERREPVFKGR